MYVSLRKKWYIDSGCSKHMTADASKFTHISPKKSGQVTYGDRQFAGYITLLQVIIIEFNFLFCSSLMLILILLQLLLK